LDVVDQKDIGLTVLLAEFNELIVLDAVNVFVRKLFRRNVSDARALFVGGDVVADGMEQMCFAKTDAAVKEKRIVGFAWRLRDCKCGSIGEIVVVADDKSFKGIFRIEEDWFLRRKGAFSRSFHGFDLGGNIGRNSGRRA